MSIVIEKADPERADGQRWASYGSADRHSSGKCCSNGERDNDLNSLLMVDRSSSIDRKRPFQDEIPHLCVHIKRSPLV